MSFPIILGGGGILQDVDGQPLFLVPMPRQQNLPAPPAMPGTLLWGFNPRRKAAVLYNNGTGKTYLSATPNIINAASERIFIIPANSVLNLEPPFAPHNALYAAGDAGHDLVYYEVVGI